MIWQYSPKSLPYPYCRLIIPLIYLFTQTFSVRLTPILCKETISVRDGVRMDSARLGRQIPAGFSRKCLEKRERMRKHDGKVRRKERCRSELFYEQHREASTFTSLWLDVRRASAAVGDESTGDNVRSPSTRLYLPEVNFLLRGRSLPRRFLVPWGGACLRPRCPLVENRRWFLSSVLFAVSRRAFRNFFSLLPSFVSLINSPTAT